MRDQALFRPIDQPKLGSNGANLFLRSSQETPALRIRLPSPRVLGQNFRRVKLRVESDRKKRHATAETFLQASHVGGEPRANVGERAACINEVENHWPAEIIGQPHGSVVLICERECGHESADGESGGRSGGHILNAGGFTPDMTNPSSFGTYLQAKRDARPRHQASQFTRMARSERHHHGLHVARDGPMRDS